MTLATPSYVQGQSSHGAALFRQAYQAHLSAGGVIGPGDLQVTQTSTASMQLNVAPGQIILPGTLGSASGFPTNNTAQAGYGLPATFTDQGCYYTNLESTAQVTISAADPTNPRIDLVVVAQEDADYQGSSNQPVLEVITGTPASSPVAPSAPASGVVLAQVSVAANATSIVTANISDERPTARPIQPGLLLFDGFGPNVTYDFTSPAANAATAVLNVVAGAKYRIDGSWFGQQINAGSNVVVYLGISSNPRLVWDFTLGQNGVGGASAATIYTAPSTGSVEFVLAITTGAGAFAVTANVCELIVSRVA